MQTLRTAFSDTTLGFALRDLTPLQRRWLLLLVVVLGVASCALGMLSSLSPTADVSAAGALHAMLQPIHEGGTACV